MATFKGMIRLKCVDLSNWASNQGLFNDVKSTDAIRYSTEGMDTVTVFVQKCDNMDTLRDELASAMGVAVEKFGALSTDFTELMNEAKAVLDAKVITQSFSMKLSQPYPYFIEVIVKVVE